MTDVLSISVGCSVCSSRVVSQQSFNMTLGQYREMGVLLWRGFDYDSVMAQCFGNHEDTSTKGKQMPVVGNFRSGFVSLLIGFHSTSDPRNTISILYHPRLLPKFHRLRV